MKTNILSYCSKGLSVINLKDGCKTPVTTVFVVLHTNSAWSDYTKRTRNSTPHTVCSSNNTFYVICMSWGTSVSIVSDYRLDDRYWILSRGKGYFL
jgi:hypothetical protein